MSLLKIIKNTKIIQKIRKKNIKIVPKAKKIN